MVNPAAHPKKFFTREEKERVVQTIREAESRTSGEICVYLERKARGHVMEHAKKIFEKLGMTKTKRRNGVLIYLSLSDRTFAVLGDRGIHERVGDDFWKDAALRMREDFAGGRFVEGLEAGIFKIGEKLSAHFPPEKRDTNELPDIVA